MPCVESFVVGREKGKGLYLVVEESERLDVRYILPESRVDVVGVQCVSLDDREGEREDEEDIKTTEEGEGVERCPKDREECSRHSWTPAGLKTV